MENMSDTKRCPYCGEEISINAKKCIHCKEWLVKPQQNTPVRPLYNSEPRQNQSIYVNTQGNRSNGVGTAGFVIALLSLLFCWVPGFNGVVWFIGLILSFCGLFKSPRGLAIAGFLISIIDLIVLIVVIGAIASIFS